MEKQTNKRQKMTSSIECDWTLKFWMEEEQECPSRVLDHSRSTFLRVPEERAKPSFIRDQLRGFRNEISIEGITQSFRFVGSLIQSGSDIEYRFSIDSKGIEHQTLSKIRDR